MASSVSAKRLANTTLAAKIGRNATATAATSARRQRQAAAATALGTSQASSRPPSSTPYITGSGGVRKRRVTSTAASTATSTPANTIAFTTQVVPNSSAKPVTFLVSSSRNAAPEQEQVGVGAHPAERPADHADREQADQQDQPERDEVDRGMRRSCR